MAEMEKKDSEGNAPINRQTFEAGIILKAWKDPEYRKRLIESPKQVVQEELEKIRPGVKLPDNLQIYLHQETPNIVHMSLPVNPAEYGEVSGDEWMDDVSGGVFGKVVVAVVAAIINTAVNINVAGNMNSAVNVNVAGNISTAGNVNAVGNVNAAANVNVAGNVNVTSTVNVTV